MKTQKLLARFATGLLLSILAQGGHAASTYPDHPITLVVPYPAGGAADAVARPLANELGKRLGQTVIVENRAGANGNIGSLYVAHQQPADGYTILLGTTSTLTVNPHLYKSMGYDPLKDLQPITLTQQTPNVLVVGAKTPYRTVADVVAAAKAKPDSLMFGSAGNGNTMHLTGVLFQQKCACKLTHVPYKGGPAALNDVLAGQIPMMFHNLPAVIAMHKAGKVRVLAVADSRRSPVLPDVPTMAEAGLPGVQSVVWTGWLVRAGTPKEIVDRLNHEMTAILKDPAFRKQQEDQGNEILSDTPDEFEALIRKDYAAMGDIVRQADIHID